MNAYKVNNKFYLLLLIGSAALLVIGIVLSFANCTSCLIVSELTKSLACGGIASIVVAWLIEKQRVKDKNSELKEKYNDLYINLKFYICCYLESWAKIVSLYNKNPAKRFERKRWWEWYEELLCVIKESDDNTKKSIINLITRQQQISSIKISGEIERILSYEPFLKVNNLINDELLSQIKNFSSEFGIVDSIDASKDNPEYYLDLVTGFNEVVKDSIDQWKEISNLNKLAFQPYKFYEGSIE